MDNVEGWWDWTEMIDLMENNFEDNIIVLNDCVV